MGEETPQEHSGKRRKFGCIRELPSGNHRADYLGPDRRRYAAPVTFQVKEHARNWLDKERALIEAGTWTPPAERARKAARKEAKKAAKAKRSEITLADYGRRWIIEHELADTTRSSYGRNLDAHAYPKLGSMVLRDIKREVIDDWYARLRAEEGGRRSREIAYTALSSMMTSAVEAGLIKKNPCRVTGAIQSHPDRKGTTLTRAQIAAVAEALASPADTAAIRAEVRSALAEAKAELSKNKRMTAKDRESALAKVRREAKRSAMVTHGVERPEWVALVMLACFSALRTGELQDLRRSDVSLPDGTVEISHAARYLKPYAIADDATVSDPVSKALAEGGWVTGASVKSEGERPVPIAPHMRDLLQHHLDNYVDPEPDALLFPPVSWTRLKAEQKRQASEKQRNQRLSSSTFFDYWKAALERAGAPDIHFHDLRHTGASLYSQAGATLKEVMELLGHRRPDTALRYQHGNDERHQALAAEVSRRAVEPQDTAPRAQSHGHTRRQVHRAPRSRHRATRG